MIGKLTGLVDSVAEDHCILDVGGVGYLVQCPTSTLAKLNAGTHASLMIETKVSDDAIRLYGFASAEEREWFRLLQTVQNVGSRVALNVLSALSPRALERALALSDKAAIGKAQGVGPKLALRIVTELKDKPIGDGLVAAFHAQASPATPPPPSAAGEAVAALMGLGVAEPAARRVVEQAALRMGDDAEAPVLIKAALQELGR